MYNEKVIQHFNNPQNPGKIENPDAIGEVGNPECGDYMVLHLKINDDHIISDIKFQTFGCAAAIACSSMVTTLAKGKHINEAEKISKQDVADALGGLPQKKMDCSNLGADALKLAIINYKKSKEIEGTKGLDDELDEHIIYDSTADKTIDLKGKECPMTFVYTKVGLESIDSGQILQVILDFKPAFTNVPFSIRKQNLGEIIKQRENDGICHLWVKKS